ncbi:MAG: septal ring lytic transglycosylase RlpA family protein [Myxococcota bacterium]|nr:septal ring lytic transglycosylase RlpA family protein [Myxococcota bacterium]
MPPAPLALLLAACLHHPPTERGDASWYGRALAGNPTASGVPFRPARRTAAHKSLPFGTVVRVTRTDTGASVRVVINDRGPFVEGRIIDLARAPARRIDMLRAGVVPVELTVVGCRRRYGRCPQP